MTGRIVPEATTDHTAPLLYRTMGVPRALALGPDGALWFVDIVAAAIGRVTTAGAVTHFPLPDHEGSQRIPSTLVAGPDGNLWFTESHESFIGRITPHGVVTEFAVPTGETYLDTLVAGPDGNLWFTVPAMGRIGRIGVDGTINEFALPTDLVGPASLIEDVALAVGPGGALWLALVGKRATTVLRLTTKGQVAARFPLDVTIRPYALAAGPDGNLWFTDPGGNRLGRMTPAGVVVTFDLPTNRVDVP